MKEGRIDIAAVPDPLNAAPVTATYRGDNIETELHTQVSVEAHSAVEVC